MPPERPNPADERQGIKTALGQEKIPANLCAAQTAGDPHHEQSRRRQPTKDLVRDVLKEKHRMLPRDEEPPEIEDPLHLLHDDPDLAVEFLAQALGRRLED